MLLELFEKEGMILKFWVKLFEFFKAVAVI